MRNLRRFGWAAAVTAAVAGPAFGQQPGGGGGGGGAPGGGATVSPAGSVTTSNGNVLGGSFGANAQTTAGNTGTSGNSTSGNSGPSTEGAQLSQFQQAPQINAPSTNAQSTASSNTGVDASNFLRGSFANPYYAGRAGLAAGATSVNAPGGFGTVLYQTSGGAAGGRAGTTTLGRGGLAGGRGSGLTNPSQIVIQPAAALAAPAQLKFAVPPPAAPALQADLRGVLNGVSPALLANPAGVQVQVADGNTVVLRGAVRDEDEARLVVGLARLTPGVRDIKSELTYPRP